MAGRRMAALAENQQVAAELRLLTSMKEQFVDEAWDKCASRKSISCSDTMTVTGRLGVQRRYLLAGP